MPLAHFNCVNCKAPLVAKISNPEEFPNGSCPRCRHEQSGCTFQYTPDDLLAGTGGALLLIRPGTASPLPASPATGRSNGSLAKVLSSSDPVHRRTVPIVHPQPLPASRRPGASAVKAANAGVRSR